MTVKEELTDLIVTMNAHSYEYGRMVQYRQTAPPYEQIVAAQHNRGYAKVILLLNKCIATYLGDLDEVHSTASGSSDG